MAGKTMDADGPTVIELTHEASAEAGLREWMAVEMQGSLECNISLKGLNVGDLTFEENVRNLSRAPCMRCWLC